MSGTKTEFTDQGYKEYITKYSNEELIAALKRRSQYREDAADFAIQEAIRRGIIHSEQDLFSEKFREEKGTFSWLPVPHTKDARERVKKSILRSLYITGLIPLAYGGLQLYRGVDFPAEIAIVFGLIWIALSVLLTRNLKKWIFYGLGVMDLGGGAFILQRIVGSVPSFFDFFAVIVLILMVLYSLVYFYRIARKDQEL